MFARHSMEHQSPNQVDQSRVTCRALVISRRLCAKGQVLTPKVEVFHVLSRTAAAHQPWQGIGARPLQCHNQDANLRKGFVCRHRGYLYTSKILYKVIACSEYPLSWSEASLVSIARQCLPNLKLPTAYNKYITDGSTSAPALRSESAHFGG